MSESKLPRRVPLSPEMIQAGVLRLGEIGEASLAYLAEEAFEAMIQVGLAQGFYEMSREDGVVTLTLVSVAAPPMVPDSPSWRL